MAKTFPKTLFVKIEKDASTEYFVADADAAGLVEMGEKIKLGVYKFVEYASVEGVAKIGRSR